MFKVGKQYKSRNGEVFTVRYISDNDKSKYPIWTENENGKLRTFTKHGSFDLAYPASPYDLILPDDPSTLKKDDPIMIKFKEYEEEWTPRYFSHIDSDEVYVYSNGSTSWTMINTVKVKEWRKPTPEEMTKQ